MTNALSVNDLKGASVKPGGSVEAGYAVGLDCIAGLDMSSYKREKEIE